MRNRRERKAQTSRRRRVDWRKYGQADEAQASSEGETRDAGRTRPTKGKEKGMEERVSTEAKEEDLGTTGNSKRWGREEERVRMAPNMGLVANTPRP